MTSNDTAFNIMFIASEVEIVTTQVDLITCVLCTARAYKIENVLSTVSFDY